jgi:cytochrome b561
MVNQGRLAGYDGISKGLHWLTAILMICQFAIAWTMPHMGRDTVPERMINLHFSFGALLLIVVIVRLAWRLKQGVPPTPAGIPRWQTGAAHAVHWLLYVLLIVSPVLGWINASWRGFPVSLFGLVEFPALIAKRAEGWRWTGDVHELLSNYAILALIGLHVAAALYHRIVRNDGVLERMLPMRNRA